MKWKNRLKTVLAETATSENSGTSVKTQLRKTANTPQTIVSAVNHSSQLRHFPKNNEVLAEIKANYFHTILNRFIEAGVKFELSTDDFQFIDKWQNLRLSDMEFLKINKQDVLCHLQQSLLMKHLFSHSPFLLDDFAFEIRERESLLTITAKTQLETYIEAVKDVTRKWFADLLERKT